MHRGNSCVIIFHQFQPLLGHFEIMGFPGPDPNLHLALCRIKCMNCDDPMGPDHQCEDLSSQRKTVMQNPNRVLNLKKLCDVCQKLHPAHKKCQTCVTSAPRL